VWVLVLELLLLLVRAVLLLLQVRRQRVVKPRDGR
jgi:hypothetical protein